MIKIAELLSDPTTWLIHKRELAEVMLSLRENFHVLKWKLHIWKNILPKVMDQKEQKEEAR